MVGMRHSRPAILSTTVGQPLTLLIAPVRACITATDAFSASLWPNILTCCLSHPQNDLAQALSLNTLLHVASPAAKERSPVTSVPFVLCSGSSAQPATGHGCWPSPNASSIKRHQDPNGTISSPAIGFMPSASN